VGQRIVHPTFGVGLIVEVRHGRGSDVLEVVFGTELKRLSARMNWELAGEGADGAALLAEAPAEDEADGDEPAADDAEPAGASIWRPDDNNAALVRRWAGGDFAD